jgi:hypothetical protein
LTNDFLFFTSPNMNKHPFVQFARLALGFVLLLVQGGCADDNNHVATANNELGGTYQVNPGLDAGLAQAKSGQPFPFN